MNFIFKNDSVPRYQNLIQPTSYIDIYHRTIYELPFNLKVINEYYQLIISENLKKQILLDTYNITNYTFTHSDDFLKQALNTNNSFPTLEQAKINSQKLLLHHNFNILNEDLNIYL